MAGGLKERFLQTFSWSTQARKLRKKSRDNRWGKREKGEMREFVIREEREGGRNLFLAVTFHASFSHSPDSFLRREISSAIATIIVQQSPRPAFWSSFFKPSCFCCFSDKKSCLGQKLSSRRDSPSPEGMRITWLLSYFSLPKISFSSFRTNHFIGVYR